MRRLIVWIIRVLAGLGLLAVLGWYLLLYRPLREPHPPLELAKGTLAIEHARIYISPIDPVIPDGTVLIQDGRIAAVGADVAVPPGATVLACNHCTVTAGFWNSHVHFTEPKWSIAEWKSVEQLNAQLVDMFTSRGFTTVVDTGSNPVETVAIRRRVETGNLNGPFIYTAGPSIYPANGIPFYIRESAPVLLQHFMPQPATPEEAISTIARNEKMGADIVKLFTGSWVERGHVLPMTLPIAQAAVERAHHDGQLVFSHPSNLQGTRVAIESGVDVLAHAPDDTEGIGRDLFAEIVRRKMAMIPTLKMFRMTVTTNPHYLDPIYAEVRQFHELGGTLIFGTDIGYMPDYSTEGEFTALSQCGLKPMDMLAMLTTAPAARFGVSDAKGTVTPGKLADLTVLDGDPALDIAAFSQVRMTIRSGKVIYQRAR